MFLEGFLIGIDLYVCLKFCRFLMIFLNGYIDILKVDFFIVKKKKGNMMFKLFFVSLIGFK